jgi:hypothetical protein
MFIKFKAYGDGRSPQYIRSDKVVSFRQISLNGQGGTEITMEDSSIIKVGEYPDEVNTKLSEGGK